MSTYVNDKTSQGMRYLKRHLRYNDYVEKGREVQGYWMGKACEVYGVKVGEVVQDKEFAALEKNTHPVTGQQLTRRNNTTRKQSYIDQDGNLATREVQNRKPFADINTGAPKEVSVAIEVFKSDLLRECEERAYAKTFREIEAITGRQIHNGQDHVAITGKLCGAVYLHTTNRCLEPQRHRHLIVFNATPDADGASYAIEFGEHSNQSRYITAVYWDALAAEFDAIGAEWERGEHGAPRLVALKEHAEIYSRRTKEIEALIERIEEHAGTKLSPSEGKTITLASRGLKIKEFEELWEKNRDQLEGLATLDPEKSEKARRKILDHFTTLVRDCSKRDLVKTTREEVEADQWALLSEDQKARGQAFVDSLSLRETPDRSRDIEGDITFAIEHVFANKSVIQEHDLFKEILLHAQGKNVDLRTMQSMVRSDQRLVFGQGREVGPKEHYKRELEMLLWIKEGKGRGVSLVSKQLDDQLNKSQRQAVKELLECPDQFSLLYGKAGVGKTFCLAEITRLNLVAGHKVFVLAPENGAREVLRQDGAKLPPGLAADVFKRAENLDEFLVNAKIRKGFGPGDLVILDEAAMASVERLNAFQRLARDNGFRVLMAGDDGQLNSIEAGDAFRIVRQHSTIHVSELTEIIRQTPEALDGAYLRASELFSQKKIRAGMYELYRAGVIKAIKGQERVKYYAGKVMESLNGSSPAVACNITHRENDAISEIVRERRKELGQLTDERPLDVHRTLGWTVAEKKEIAKIKPGMILQVTRGHDKGKAWKVFEVVGGKALAEDIFGQRTSFEEKHARMFDVCEQRQIQVACGDHLRTHSGGKGPNKGKEIINGELFMVAGWDSAGNPVDCSGKSLTVRNVSYGYTGTVRKVQGSTKDKDIFGLDRKSVRAATQEIVNVACTRGRNDIEILVESLADLAQIEKKSSRRKAVCEMTPIDGRELPAEIRDLKARLEQARGEQPASDKMVQAKRAPVDLQLGKRVRRHLELTPAQKVAAQRSYSHNPDQGKTRDREIER